LLLVMGSTGVAVALAAVAVLAVGGGDGSSPVDGASAASPAGPSPVLAKAGVPLIVHSRDLLLPDGRTIPLTPIEGGVLRAYQTRDGWLAVGLARGTSASTLWLVKPDASVNRLVSGVDGGIAVAPDGRRFAWRAGNRLNTGHLNADGTLAADRSVPAPRDGSPVAYAGNAVVLGYTDASGGRNFDVWLPDGAGYTPGWDKSRHVLAVYGPTPDGTAVLGVVRGSDGRDGCLARLDPAANLRATATACGPQYHLDTPAPISLDGRWLAVQKPEGSGSGRVAVIDLTSVFQKPVFAAGWDADGPGVWADPTTMVGVRVGKLVRFRIGQDAPEPVAAPNLPAGAPFELVTVLSTAANPS
jgi:hypothetical protein